jgi:hypothetical protein
MASSVPCLQRLQPFPAPCMAMSTRLCCFQPSYRRLRCCQFPYPKLWQPRLICAHAAEPPGRGDCSLWTAFLHFVDMHFLPLGLLTALLCGFCFPNAAVAAGKADISMWATTTVFIISGDVHAGHCSPAFHVHAQPMFRSCCHV